METTVEEHNAQQVVPDAVGEVRICLGWTTELTLGGAAGSSEDKRYVYG